MTPYSNCFELPSSRLISILLPFVNRNVAHNSMFQLEKHTVFQLLKFQLPYLNDSVILVSLSADESLLDVNEER